VTDIARILSEGRTAPLTCHLLPGDPLPGRMGGLMDTYFGSWSFYGGDDPA